MLISRADPKRLALVFTLDVCGSRNVITCFHSMNNCLVSQVVNVECWIDIEVGIVLTLRLHLQLKTAS